MCSLIKKKIKIHLPVYDALCMQMLQAARDFSGIEDCSLLLKAWVTCNVLIISANVINTSGHR